MKHLPILFTVALLLGGCSGMRVVESQVRAEPALQSDETIAPGAPYRFERLPSQTDPVEADSIEAIAEAELNEAGLLHDPANARYSVQLSWGMQTFHFDDWGRPTSTPRASGGLMIGGGIAISIGAGGMVGMRAPPPPRYRHEARLLLRDLKSNQIVYDTRATHEGGWNDRYNILRALLAAALKDFPNPPAGTRRVKVEIPR